MIPTALWPYLPAFLKKQLCRRVIVTGAESTGTTTLALDLASALDCPYAPEYGREYTITRNRLGKSDWTPDELEHIAGSQIKQENNQAARTRNGWMVGDTDAVTTLLWQERYFGTVTDRLLKLVKDRPDPFAYILTADDIPFKADSIREGGEDRHKLQQRLRDILTQNETPWIEVHGEPEVRLKRALEFIQGLK